MSQGSLHGKWTVSSSDDDDDDGALPLSGTTTWTPPQPATSASSSPPSGPGPKPGLKAEAANPPVSARQVNPPLPGKRKKEVSDGAGWALSDSDDEDEDAEKAKSLSRLPEKEPPHPKAKKAKAESERPPSPHGRVYYLDEPEDFFESSVPRLNDMYRFYLNKVTGVDRKYNSGALHIRGERLRSRPGPPLWTALNSPSTAFYL